MMSALLLLLLCMGGLVYLGAKSHALLVRHQTRQLGRRQQAATDAIDTEYRRVRRAMNDAAGKAWRNLFE